MFARRGRGHAEEKRIAGLRRRNRYQPAHRGLSQGLLARRLRPIRRIGGRRFRLVPVKLAPNPANEAEAIRADMFDAGLMAIGCVEPAFRAGQNGGAGLGVHSFVARRPVADVALAHPRLQHIITEEVREAAKIDGVGELVPAGREGPWACRAFREIGFVQTAARIAKTRIALAGENAACALVQEARLPQPFDGNVIAGKTDFADAAFRN